MRRLKRFRAELKNDDERRSSGRGIRSLQLDQFIDLVVDEQSLLNEEMLQVVRVRAGLELLYDRIKAHDAYPEREYALVQEPGVFSVFGGGNILRFPSGSLLGSD